MSGTACHGSRTRNSPRVTSINYALLLLLSPDACAPVHVSSHAFFSPAAVEIASVPSPKSDARQTKGQCHPVWPRISIQNDATLDEASVSHSVGVKPPKLLPSLSRNQDGLSSHASQASDPLLVKTCRACDLVPNLWFSPREAATIVEVPALTRFVL